MHLNRRQFKQACDKIDAPLLYLDGPDYDSGQTHCVIHKFQSAMMYAMNLIAKKMNELGCHGI